LTSLKSNFFWSAVYVNKIPHSIDRYGPFLKIDKTKLVVTDMVKFCVLLFSGLVMSAIKKHRRLLGEAVRAKRREAEFSQEKLAEKADLSTVFISRIERGLNPLPWIIW